MTNSNDTVGTTATDSGSEVGDDSGYQGAEVVTMSEDTTTQATPAKAPKAAKAPKEKKSYPFLTKAQIAASIGSDFQFACSVIVTLYDRQTTFEQETKSTLNKNRRGFMSSHAVNGTKLALKIRAGEDLTDEDVARVHEIAPRYTKQMADHFRQAAIEADPALAAKAACFFTPQ
jgi:hypothetical protein